MKKNNNTNVQMYKAYNVNNVGTFKKPKKSPKKVITIVVAGVVLTIFVFSSAFNLFLKSQDSKRDSQEYAVSQVYYTQVNDYNDIIKDAKEFIADRTNGKPAEIFAVFNQMLWNGYFSEGHEFEFGNTTSVDIPFNEGIDVFDGDAVCRHNANLLSKIFNEFGLVAFPVNVLTNNDLKIDKQEGIERQVGSFVEGGFGNYFTDSYGNHVIVLVIDGNETTFYDPTNLCAYKLGDDDRLYLINGEGSIEWKEKSQYQLNGIDLDEMKKIKQVLKDNPEGISLETINTAFDNALDDINANKSEYEDFYNDQIDTYREINNSLR